MDDRLQEVSRALGLNQQERALYARHLRNSQGGGVKNSDGSLSTIRSITIEEDGKHYVLPTVWDGKILSGEEAVRRAAKEGLEKFPSYGSNDEALSRYEAMHKFMEEEQMERRRKKLQENTIMGNPDARTIVE